MIILIVGFGSVAAKHAKACQDLAPGCKIYALRSAVNVAEPFGIHNIYSWNEITETPDFIIISNPTKFHGEAIKKAIRYRCPLFIEKPLVVNLKEGQDILPMLQQNKILTYVACNLRFHPAIQYLKNWTSGNHAKINEVNIYCGSYLPDWRKNGDYTSSYSARQEMGGGVQLDLIHEIDYCYWLFGKPLDVISRRRKVSSLKINSSDFAFYHLVYSNFTANIILNYYRIGDKREIEILTEDETITADLLMGKVRNHQSIELFSSDRGIPHTYGNQMEYFLEHVKNNRQPMNDFNEALDVLKIALQ